MVIVHTPSTSHVHSILHHTLDSILLLLHGLHLLLLLLPPVVLVLLLQEAAVDFKDFCIYFGL